jgi:uncharacterized oxidoreductase
MNIQNKTALVTGAGSGIGYAIAQLLKENGNNVIIAGRNAAKIKRAGDVLGVPALVCDLSKESDIRALVEKVKTEYPDLSVLVNNAGVANLYKLGENAGAFEKASYEFQVNYFGPILLTELLLPLLKRKAEAAIVNITSNVTFHPIVVLPTYSDTKAALHSHTVALRLGLANDTGVKVFEVMPSLVDTEATKDMGGANGIQPREVAEDLIAGIQNNEYEIYVGETAQQRAAYFKNPVEAIANFNKGL